MILAGDFNINAFRLRYNMILTKNKPTTVGKNSATATDHITANCILDCQFKTVILKIDVTDHLPIAMAL